jgi:hypothetical protein
MIVEESGCEVSLPVSRKNQDDSLLHLVRHWLVPAGQLEAWATTGVTSWTYLLTQLRVW